jgi:carbon storage regulator
MLIIRRKAGEGLLIGENIEIQIIEVSPTRVKIGILAPPEVTILRKEVKLTGEQNVAASRGISAQSIAALAARLRR